MKPSLHTIVLALALISAAVATILLADAWQSARRDAAQLASTLAQQNTAIQQAADREKQREAQLTTALSAIATQKTAVQTPQEAAKALPSVLPPLPLPISISIPELQPSSNPAAASAASDLPAAVAIPQADLKPLYDALQDCRATTLQAASLTKDLADEKTKTSALATERDAAVTAAHGGTFLVRLKREAKWLAIGIAVGAITAEVAQHR